MRPNTRETEDLVTFTEEILMGKLHFFLVVGFVSSIIFELYFGFMIFFLGIQLRLKVVVIE